MTKVNIIYILLFGVTEYTLDIYTCAAPLRCSSTSVTPCFTHICGTPLKTHQKSWNNKWNGIKFYEIRARY